MNTLIESVTVELKKLKKYNVVRDRKYFSTDMSYRRTKWRNKAVYDDMMTNILRLLKEHGYEKII